MFFEPRRSDPPPGIFGGAGGSKQDSRGIFGVPLGGGTGKEFSLFGEGQRSTQRNTWFGGASNAQGKGNEDVNVVGALGVLILLVGIIFSGGRGEAKLQQLYFQNFELIYGAAFAGICLLAATVWWFVHKHTRPLAERITMLRPARDPRSGILAGRTIDGVKLYVPDVTRLGHVQILGATGKGKTESVILPWIVQDLARGHDVIALDGKGDPELVRRIQDELPPSVNLARIFREGHIASSGPQGGHWTEGISS